MSIFVAYQTAVDNLEGHVPEDFYFSGEVYTVEQEVVDNRSLQVWARLNDTTRVLVATYDYNGSLVYRNDTYVDNFVGGH